jgi:hypothetical protein
MPDAVARCCQDVSAPTKSPFEIVQLGWNDGISDGLARCKLCGTTYAFDVVCAEGDLRVYGFARIAEAHYRAVASALRRPPPPVEKLQEWLRVVAEVESIVPRAASNRDLFVLARHLEDEVLLARRVRFAAVRAFLERSDD